MSTLFSAEHRLLITEAMRDKFGPNLHVIFRESKTAGFFGLTANEHGLMACYINMTALAARAAVTGEPVYVPLIRCLYHDPTAKAPPARALEVESGGAAGAAGAAAAAAAVAAACPSVPVKKRVRTDDEAGLVKKAKISAASSAATAAAAVLPAETLIADASFSGGGSSSGSDGSGSTDGAENDIVLPPAQPAQYQPIDTDDGDDDDYLADTPDHSVGSCDASSVSSAAATVVAVTSDKEDATAAQGSDADDDSSSSSSSSDHGDDGQLAARRPVPRDQLRVGDRYEMLRVGQRCLKPLRIDDETGTGVFVSVILMGIDDEGLCTVYAPDVAYETKSKKQAVESRVPYLYRPRRRSSAQIAADADCSAFPKGALVDTEWFVYEDTDRFKRWYPSRIVGTRRLKKDGSMVYLADAGNALNRKVPPEFVRTPTDTSLEPADRRPLRVN